MSVSVIICAAGKGLRAGFGKNKLLVPLDGTPVLQRTLQAFYFENIDEIIIAHSPDDKAEISALIAPFPNVKLIEGGATRTQTVYNALQAVQNEIVLIHDGARPFVTREVIEGCIESVKTHRSGICAVACTDTIAVKSNANEIVDVPVRSTLVRIQTPQGFYVADIKAAYKQALQTNASYTDDSSVYHAFVRSPILCEGSEENVKLTYPSDYARYEKTERVGFGIDTHAFGKEQDYIVLAGVKVPSASGLIAHSDGDVLVHAVMDAMLSAVGLKDIGHYFPDTDEKWRGASSMAMLARVDELVREQGFAVANLSVSIQAERPRLAKYIDEMKASLAQALHVDVSKIGVSAGTNEGLGYVGEGKGITVHAYVLLKRK